MTQSCSNCQFGHVIEHEGGVDTFCRFNPPEFIPPNGSALKPTRPDNWCGKWQKRPSATKSVPAPVSDPNTERSPNLSVHDKRKKGVAAII